MFKMLKWAWHSAARAHSRSHSPQVKTPSLLLAKNATHVATRQRGVCVMCVYCFICVAHKFVYSTFSMAAQRSAAQRLHTSRSLCAFPALFCFKVFPLLFPSPFPHWAVPFSSICFAWHSAENIYAILKREQQQAICGYLNCSHADIPSIYCISHNNSILFIFQFRFSQKTVAPLAVFFSRRWRNVIDTSMTKQQ